MFNAHMFFSKSKKINFSPEDAWRVAMRKLGQNPIVRKNFNFLEKKTYKTLITLIVCLFGCLFVCLRPCVRILDTEWLL